ncbi:hypothetical protein KSS87_001002 [Heliosperma pusillum]|nr:hypothetical protein KSS87_001002 [Heliosperma pusillum]
MAKSMRSKREKRLRALRREMVEPLYESKETAKLAAQAAALAAPKLPVRNSNTTSSIAMDALPSSSITSAMDVEMADGQTTAHLKPAGGVGKKMKKKLKLAKGKKRVIITHRPWRRLGNTLRREQVEEDEEVHEATLVGGAHATVDPWIGGPCSAGLRPTRRASPNIWPSLGTQFSTGACRARPAATVLGRVGPLVPVLGRVGPGGTGNPPKLASSPASLPSVPDPGRTRL